MRLIEPIKHIIDGFTILMLCKLKVVRYNLAIC